MNFSQQINRKGKIYPQLIHSVWIASRDMPKRDFLWISKKFFKKIRKEIFKINFYFVIYEKPLTLPHLSSKIKYAIFLKNGAVRVPVIEK